MTARHRTRRATAGAVPALALALAGALTGCGGDSPADTARKAESAVGSIASRASGAAESAAAEAERRLGDIQDGVDARADVEAGAPVTGSDGRVRSEVTVRNTDDTARSFAVQVNFEDSGGGLADTVIVTIDQVQAGQSATATARSTHELSGGIRVEVARAVRY
ncbi:MULTISPECIES: hypothetical protein [unclassified Streptomyces]|jgi:hypothetical protein|uniref:hypothetical protein n=1 Tax=unclassified Streptomyces TaxID=2593676 RepID=UPI003CF58D8C